MCRFTTIPTAYGAVEIFDNLIGRPFDVRPTFEAAQRKANELNGLLAGKPAPWRVQAHVLASDVPH